MTTARVDLVTAEVVRNGLTAAAIEMNRTLVRTAYNPLLYEVKDFCVGIISGEGLLWAEAPGITAFLGGLASTVRSGLATLGLDGYRPGDILIVNDPYLTGTHISDTTVYMPIFAGDELLAFAMTTAHWADIGGKTPGGWCPDSTDVYQEGICFHHQHLFREGERIEDLWNLIAGNVRFPETVLGDLAAQVAACRQGEARTLALAKRYGTQGVRAAMEDTIARTDEFVRREIAAIPDGIYSASIRMDHDGVTDGAVPLIALTLTVEGDRIIASFDGTDHSTKGPINLPAVGARAAIRVALKGLLMPVDPTNEGHFRAIEFDLPPGLVVSPERPAPCDSYGYVFQALLELTVRAMARAVPERCPAGNYQLFGIYLFRVDPRDGAPFIMIEPVPGGNGGLPDGDGQTLVFLLDGDTPNTPIEVAETRYPVLVERLTLRPEAAGAGRYRGGYGIFRDYRARSNGTYLAIATENVKDPLVRGVNGGADGLTSRVIAWPDTERERILEDKTFFFGPLAAGDSVSVQSGGGGGWGDPLDRDPPSVVRDVEDDLLTLEDASAIYGVVIHETGIGFALDDSATAELRLARRHRSA
jgi:N-methylhydantoinase B